jgi:hypothetical protein
MTFRTVFDAGQHGYATAWAPAFGLMFVVIGVLLVLRPALFQRLTLSGLQVKPKKIFSWSYLIFALFWTVESFLATFRQYQTAVYDLRTGRYSVLEGPVTDFVPMPYTGHSEERFTVNGHRFSYSDYIVTLGFNNTASHGGPIREGLYVRVTYDGNLILRLEVAE